MRPKTPFYIELKKWMKYHNVTADFVGAAISCSPASVYQWAHRNPSPQTLKLFNIMFTQHPIGGIRLYAKKM